MPLKETAQGIHHEASGDFKVDLTAFQQLEMLLKSVHMSKEEYDTQKKEV